MLKVMTATGNKIEDVIPFSVLFELVDLDISYNNISNWEVIKHKNELPH